MDLAIGLGIGLLALAERLSFLGASTDRKWPHSVLFEGDAPLWIDWLRAIHAGVPFELGLPIHSPAVPHVLALLGAGSIPESWVVYKSIWCVVSALSAIIMYIAALRTAGRSVAIVASLWFALSFHANVLATSLNGETLYTFLLVSIIALGTVRARGPASLALAIAVGALHGLATLTRAEHTLLMLMLLGWSVAFPAPATPIRDWRPRARALSLSTLTLAMSVAVCLPWSIAGSRASERMNRVSDRLPDYARLSPPWSADARAFMDSLPPFVRADNAAYLSALAAQRGEPGIDGARVHRYFAEEFGWTPTPLHTRIFVSSQGPLCFALANHPDAGGGFSRAAFDSRFGPDPNLTFSLPSHLHLYNDGYAVGMGYIRSDPAAWLGLVARKLLRFEAGATGGLGLTNTPIGRDLVRWPVDLAVVPLRPSTWSSQPVRAAVAADALWWRLPLLTIMLLGVFRLVRERKGGVWLLIILSKLVVTIAFYGYARQSASILPALAIPLGAGLIWLWRVARLPRRTGPITFAVCVAALLTGDAIELANPRVPTIDAEAGSVRPGRVNSEDGAFECFKELLIEYGTRPEPSR